MGPECTEWGGGVKGFIHGRGTYATRNKNFIGEFNLIQ